VWTQQAYAHRPHGGDKRLRARPGACQSDAWGGQPLSGQFASGKSAALTLATGSSPANLLPYPASQSRQTQPNESGLAPEPPHIITKTRTGLVAQQAAMPPLPQQP